MTETPAVNPFAARPDALTLPFWDAAKRGEFEMPRCDDCSRFHFYPKPLCPFCGSGRLSWRRAQPTGLLVALTRVHRPPAPNFEPSCPYTLAIAVLDEGPAFFARFAPGGDHDAAVGDRISIAFRHDAGDLLLPIFERRRPNNVLPDGPEPKLASAAKQQKTENC